MAETRVLSWGEVYNLAGQVFTMLQENFKPVPAALYGIPTGGCLAAQVLQTIMLRNGFFVPIVDSPNVEDCLVVDDLVDSGRTIERYLASGRSVVVLCRKSVTPASTVARLLVEPPILDGWIQFPWEHDSGPTDAVVRLLSFVGEDPNRDGLLNTPTRVVKALREMTAGYQDDPKQILSTTFEQVFDEMIVLKGIRFHSLCEHHLLPFSGTATVGYLPSDRVVGISKLARLVECFSKRLQIQERLTDQISGAIMEHLAARGAGVVIRAKHHCMGCRGVKQPDTDMVTSSMLGFFRTDAQARAEFFSLARE